MTTHLMLDIETLGTRPGCVVLSAAIVRFSDLQSTSVVLDRKDQEAAGLVVDPQTWDWWQTQPNAAWCAAVNNPIPLVPALQHLAAWIAWAAPSGDALVWCHGAGFDGPILQRVFEVAGVACPWAFWNVRCTRTLYDLAGVDVAAYRTGMAHVALDDAMAQTRAAVEGLKVLARAHAVAA